MRHTFFFLFVVVESEWYMSGVMRKGVRVMKEYVSAVSDPPFNSQVVQCQSGPE
jgi:hypothetical protein